MTNSGQTGNNAEQIAALAQFPAIPQSYLCVAGGYADAAGMSSTWGGRPAIITATSPQLSPTSLAQLAAPSTTLVVVEHASRVDPELWANTFDFTNHLGTSNFLFADGHVKALKPMATTNPNMWTAEDDGDTLSSVRKGQISTSQATMN